MKIYLAAPFEYQERMRIIRETLHMQPGLQVVSRWLDEEFSSLDSNAATCAVDLSDVRAADVLVVQPKETPRQGHVFEAGYAYGLGHKVAVVGPTNNLFLNEAEGIQHFSDWPSCIAWLNKEQSERYANLSPINLRADIVGTSSAGPDEQTTFSSRFGDDWTRAAQRADFADWYKRRADEHSRALEIETLGRQLAEGAD